MSDKKRANSVYVYRMLDGKHEWDYGNGRIIRCNADLGSAQARHFLLNYGVKQWVQDGGAVSAGDDGKVDVQAKYEGMLERAGLIESGVDQLLRRKSAAVDEAGLVIMALMRVRGLDTAGANALVDKIAAANKMERKAVLANMASKNADIIRTMADIKAERAAASNVNAVDLLDQMMTGDTGDEE